MRCWEILGKRDSEGGLGIVHSGSRVMSWRGDDDNSGGDGGGVNKCGEQGSPPSFNIYYCDYHGSSLRARESSGSSARI